MPLFAIGAVPAATRAEFSAGVVRIAAALGIPANWLMGVFWAESRVGLRPNNIQHGRLIATGLIQFTQIAITELNRQFGHRLTLGAMQQKSLTQQLPFVQDYFRRQMQVFGRPKTAEDLYLLTFTPAAMGKPDGRVLYRKGSPAYAQNRLDYNGDATISVGEVREFFRRQLQSGENYQMVLETAKTAAQTSFSLSAFVLVSGGVDWLIRREKSIIFTLLNPKK